MKKKMKQEVFPDQFCFLFSQMLCTIMLNIIIKYN